MTSLQRKINLLYANGDAMQRVRQCVPALSLIMCLACMAKAQEVPPPTMQEIPKQETVIPEPTKPGAPNPNPATPTKLIELPEAPGPGGGSSVAGSSAKNLTCKAQPCPTPIIDWYTRFLNGPQVRPLSPREKARLAMKNVLDPFNAVTILGDAAISVGSDSHSPYGPGMPGFGRYVGVSLTQDLTGEFINTFLIPSIVHQDPHYHRMPHASIPRRIGHAIVQVVWTQGDNGQGMVNYSNLVGYAIDDQISNLYVPGRKTNAGAVVQRYGVGLGFAPIDNFITEFLPDLARHLHVQIVVVQRVINKVAKTGPGDNP